MTVAGAPTVIAAAITVPIMETIRMTTKHSHRWMFAAVTGREELHRGQVPDREQRLRDPQRDGRISAGLENDLALIAAAFGPYHQFGPNFGPGRPSPASLQIAQDMGWYVNSLQWQGDPPR